MLLYMHHYIIIGNFAEFCSKHGKVDFSLQLAPNSFNPAQSADVLIGNNKNVGKNAFNLNKRHQLIKITKVNIRKSRILFFSFILILRSY